MPDRENTAVQYRYSFVHRRCANDGLSQNDQSSSFSKTLSEFSDSTFAITAE